MYNHKILGFRSSVLNVTVHNFQGQGISFNLTTVQQTKNENQMLDFSVVYEICLKMSNEEKSLINVRLCSTSQCFANKTDIYQLLFVKFSGYVYILNTHGNFNL